MFTEKTFDFLIENRLQNSREWYAEHKTDFLENVYKPLVELAESVGPTLLGIDEKIVITPKTDKAISRVYRDTRFSKDKSLYRESMWLTFKRDKKQFEHYPEFFFVITPEQFMYGCGYYYEKPDTVKMRRELICADDKAFKNALKAYKNQNSLVLDGEKLKKSKFTEFSGDKREWLDVKNICFTHYSTDFGILFSGEIEKMLIHDFALMKSVYDFLILNETKAAGILK